ncbi:transcription factor bHLH80 [Impatiens glandulifera]|uniref:transcription factor bHLH80 n=1 Tax=Impatiens glandulifera TaxID=253017 RepID=UPI001FB0BB97|nr:transcription factor bHLH80 [Impatiens glandulifera]
MQSTDEELNRGGGGLARFRSAPTTFLESLLDSDEEDLELLNPTTSQTFTQLLNFRADHPLPLFDSIGTASGMDFLRQSSSPAEFLANMSSASGNFFSELGIPSANYNNVSSSSPMSLPPSCKRPRDADASAKLMFQMVCKGEQSGHSDGGVSPMEDLDLEKLLKGSVPCRVRARRGFATNPRSISERVRRTRISDRMRKLQELVPKMDKQTNTVDMLDEAVEYVKFLQEQIQELTDHKKKCRCSNRDYWKI